LRHPQNLPRFAPWKTNRPAPPNGPRSAVSSTTPARRCNAPCSPVSRARSCRRGVSSGRSPANPTEALARAARRFLAELDLADPVGDFRAFIRSRHGELETGSLLLARTVSPRLDPAACRAQLDALAARCRELIVAPASAREQCRLINRVLFHEWGFHGNVEHYTDPRNSLLDQVLARRTGLPLSLSLVYLLVARRLGLELSPVGLPGHFLVGCFSDDRPFFIDPFDRGVFRDAAELFDLLRARHVAPKLSDLAPTPAREVLCRCCRNLVNHYAAAGELRARPPVRRLRRGIRGHPGPRRPSS
jgi:regulator of sirC expression with transglutaminase-like and TPR domain